MKKLVKKVTLIERMIILAIITTISMTAYRIYLKYSSNTDGYSDVVTYLKGCK
jgi:Tfp pilus assembly protein PilE